MAEPDRTHILLGLSRKSIDRANKSVQNFGSWEEARDYAKRRIKELQFSLVVFNRMIKNGEPWPGTDGNISETAATRNQPTTKFPGKLRRIKDLRVKLFRINKLLICFVSPPLGETCCFC